jgi:hypothetical protein
VIGKASSSGRASWRRGLIVGLVVLVCAALAGTAAAAPASGGRHLPDFSLLNERVAIKKLPFPMRMLFRSSAHVGSHFPHAPKHGPVWFGEAERQGVTIQAAGTSQWLCDFESASGRLGGGGGICTTFDSVRELDGLSVDSCNGSHQFLVSGLAPNGVTGLTLERSDGKIERTIPVIDNTISFSVGHVNLTLRGVGDAAAERLERSLPLGASRGSFGGDCSGYAFTEVKPKPGS